MDKSGEQELMRRAGVVLDHHYHGVYRGTLDPKSRRHDTTRPAHLRLDRARWFAYGFGAGVMVLAFVMAIVEDEDDA
jgi:hypothetical protein